MKNSRALLPVGIFDSGIGGISVLAEIIRMLPSETFIYYADTLNSPYGTKPESVVRSLSIKAGNFLSRIGIKSLVVACNTATSAAITDMRNLYDFPVVGMEPAVKPAVELGRKGNILVMATPLTLNSKKFNDLSCHYKHLCKILPLPCSGLVEIIEQGLTRREEIVNYLSRLFSPIKRDEISAIVLGCTHYVLIKKEIRKFIGNEIAIIDGNYGTAKRLKIILQNEQLLNSVNEETPSISIKAPVRFCFSGDEDKNREKLLATYRQLLQNEGITCE